MCKTYYANGFLVVSDIVLQGWETKSNFHNVCWKCLMLKYSEFDICEDNDKWPYIYQNEVYTYFIWHGRVAMRISNDLSHIHYRLKKDIPTCEVTYALNYILAYIAPFIGKIALHGCAVSNTYEEATLFLAKSGIGKSTLVRKLMERNYGYISEELIIVNCISKPSIAYSSSRVVRIRDCNIEPAITVLSRSEDDGKTALWNSAYKLGHAETIVRNIVIIERDECKNRQLESISKIVAAQKIIKDYLYNRKVIEYCRFQDLLQKVFGLVSDASTYIYTIYDYPCVDDLIEICN